MRKKYTLSDIKTASIINVQFESDEYALFKRISDDEWYYEHWWKHLCDYEEGGLTDSDVLGFVNRFPESVRIEKGKTLRGHRTRTPNKKSCPLKVNFREMI